MDVVVAAIAHASIAGGQGGPSNLQRFMAHRPSDTTRIRLAAFQLEGESQVWWD